MTAPALRYLVTADDKASATFRRIRGEIDGLKAGTQGLRNIIGPLGPQLAGAFTVAAVGAWINRTVEGVDALNDLKDATGASIENLSALEDVAARTGTSLDTAGSAVVKLNQALNTASDPKSGAAQAIKAIGMSVEELKRLDPVQALQAIGVALAGFEDDGNKGRIILELLGRSAKDLAPLLKDLAEAGKLQATVTTEQAEEAEKLRKEWFALEKDAVNLSRTLAGPLVSSINATIALFREGRKEGKGFFDILRGEQLKLLGLGDVTPGLDQMMSRMRELDSLLNTPRRLGLSIGQAPALEAERKQLQAQIDAARADAKSAFLRGDKDTGPAARPKLPDLPADGKPGKNPKARAEEIDAASQALARYVDGLSRAIEAEKGLSAEQEAQGFLKSLGATGEVEQVRTLVLGLAAEKDMREDLAAQAKLQAAARSEIIAQQLADQEKLNRLLAATPAGKEKERLDTVLFINQAFDAGLVTLGQWNELTAQLDDNIEDAGKAAKDVGAEIGLVFASAAGEAITHWQGVKGLFKGILQDIAQIAQRELVTKPLGDMVSGALKGFDFKSIGASLLSAAFGGGRASGGPVSAGRLYEVNEHAGPGELLRVGSRQYLMPRQDGHVVPQSQASAPGSGAGHNNTYVFQVAAGSTVDEWRRSQRAVAAEMSRRQRRAGAIA